MQNRHGETGHVPFRNGRFRCIDDRWFFSTRAPSKLHGPYKTQDEAEAELQRWLRENAR